jgi:energy-coupling factor transporter ATP-binding protein EcfA2
MSPLLFLPSIALGLLYSLGSGNWVMLGASTITALVTFLVSLRSRQVPDGELRLERDRVWLGENRLPKRQLLWSRKLSERVFERYLERRAISFDELRALRNRGWSLGVPNSYLVGAGQTFRLNEGAGHLLVVGPTGSGKSELLHLALASLDERTRVVVADYKGGALLTESSISRSTSDLETLEHQNDFWLHLDQELANRESNLRAKGFASIEQAERLGESEPRLLVIVDEVVAAIRSSAKALDSLTRIATKGRSLGIHLLVTSQSLIGIPREVLINLRSRLALSGTDEVELLQLGCKEKMAASTEQTKAAMLMHDGQTFKVQVPLGARREPRKAA